MIPSREHFLLKRRNALSTFSFSPTLTVDILFTILCLCVYSYSVIIAKQAFYVKPFLPLFSNFFRIFAFAKYEYLSGFIGFYPFLSNGVFLNTRARNLPRGACTKDKRNRGAGFLLRGYNRKFYIPKPWAFCLPLRGRSRLLPLWA